MNLRRYIPVAAILALASQASAAAGLNGTELANTVKEAFIVLAQLLTSMAELVPVIISVSIQFSILGAVVGFFALVLYILKAGVGKGLKQ